MTEAGFEITEDNEKEKESANKILKLSQRIVCSRKKEDVTWKANQRRPDLSTRRGSAEMILNSIKHREFSTEWEDICWGESFLA